MNFILNVNVLLVTNKIVSIINDTSENSQTFKMSTNSTNYEIQKNKTNSTS